MTRYRRVKFLNTSARRSNCSPPRPNGVTIRRQGTKALVKTLEARDRRSPLTTWRMARIAKGSYCRARCSQKQALAQIAKSGGLRFRSELLAVLASGRGGCRCWRFLTRGFAMHNRIDIDPKHTAEQSFKRSGRDCARSRKKSRNARGALERKSTGSANWKSSHHQSFQRLSVGTSVAVEPLLDSTDRTWTSKCHR
jgi:hypothetical protein